MRKLAVILLVLALGACLREPAPEAAPSPPETPLGEQAPGVSVDRFADVELLRYAVAGFDELPLEQKKLVYYLSRAALERRDRRRADRADS